MRTLVLAWTLPAALALHKQRRGGLQQPRDVPTVHSGESDNPIGGNGRLHTTECSEAWGRLRAEDAKWKETPYRNMQWSPMVKTAEDIYQDPLAELPQAPQDRLCPVQNFIAASEMTGAPKLAFDSLIVDSIPKAASTAIRTRLVPSLAPNLTRGGFGNPDGNPDDHRGVENTWHRCGDVWSEHSHDDIQNSFRLAFVRNPFDRFMAGLSEVAATHFDHYQAWRRNHSLESTAVPDPAVRASMHGFLEEYLKDMRRGYRNVHTRTTTSFLFGNRYMRVPDFIAHVEKANAGWTNVRKRLHMPTSLGLQEFPEAHVANEEEAVFQAGLRGAFGDRVWELFCDFFFQDFQCLGYDAPEPCKRYWSVRPSADDYDGNKSALAAGVAPAPP